MGYNEGGPGQVQVQYSARLANYLLAYTLALLGCLSKQPLVLHTMYSKDNTRTAGGGGVVLVKHRPAGGQLQSRAVPHPCFPRSCHSHRR
jgi:hypothetical protein